MFSPGYFPITPSLPYPSGRMGAAAYRPFPYSAGSGANNPFFTTPVVVLRPIDPGKSPPPRKTGASDGQAPSGLKNLASMLSRIPKAERSPQEEGSAQSVYDAMAEYTVENSSVPVKILNFWMHIQDLLAAPLHGGEKLHRWRPENRPPSGKISAHSQAPKSGKNATRYPGLWPGVYKPGGPSRRYFLDPFSLLGCTWDTFNAFFNYASQYDSMGTGLVAGVAEAVNVTGLGYYYAENIMYPCMDGVMKGLGKIFPRVGKINRELAGKAPRELTRKGIPLSYRMTRTFAGGAVALAVIEGLIRSYSRWVTPYLAKTLGPQIDGFFGHNKERAKAHLVHHVLLMQDPKTGQLMHVVQPVVVRH